MPDKRKAYAPFSLITESGVTNAPVEGYIDVNQEIQPIVSTGTVNENGIWTGVKSNDTDFKIAGTDENIPNGGEVLVPGGSKPYIDLAGFENLQLAIKPSNGGNYAIEAVMGPDTYSYANLSPVNPAAALKGCNIGDSASADFAKLFSDTSEALTADVWNIFIINNNLANQRLLQFTIANNSGGTSDIEAAFMRLV